METTSHLFIYVFDSISPISLSLVKKKGTKKNGKNLLKSDWIPIIELHIHKLTTSDDPDKF